MLQVCNVACSQHDGFMTCTRLPRRYYHRVANKKENAMRLFVSLVLAVLASAPLQAGAAFGDIDPSFAAPSLPGSG